MDKATTSSTTLDTLIAEREITRVLMLYARGIDRIDTDLVQSCFHPDAVLRYGADTTPEQFTSNASGGLSSYRFTQHRIGNVIIDIEGDFAWCESYCLARHRIPVEDGPDKDFLWGGRYVDRFERRNGEWLILQRTVVHDYTRFDPVTETWEGAPSFTQGQHSTNDIVYQR
ncbi:MAG: hypothetical protein CL897_05575 [Dehalococcoidia bacterium]|nr:hypothetical protein [Dehalococcoidia bacterium]HCV00456.1 nuclear transport factor 2 family protein [Dehalococcoidia bacterium]|tara:strand:- start:1768 stop:2280 length:513 start_codon:yes stop_codon:yes gene_type:complete